MWTLAKVKNGFHDLPNERFHTFVIKNDGEIVGELKFDRARWKSAGGPAWKGTLFKTSLHNRTMSSGCTGVTYYSKKKEDVLTWFKTGEVR
jgi:hypothetical protein